MWLLRRVAPGVLGLSVICALAPVLLVAIVAIAAMALVFVVLTSSVKVARGRSQRR